MRDPISGSVRDTGSGRLIAELIFDTGTEYVEKRSMGKMMSFLEREHGVTARNYRFKLSPVRFERKEAP